MLNIRVIGLILLLAAAISPIANTAAPSDSSAAGQGIQTAEPRHASELVCLMYHRFVSAEDYTRLSGDERVYSIAVERFEEQLAELRREGFHAASTAEALAFAKGDVLLPNPTVLITIDDGNRSVLTLAEPLLRKYAMRATLFVTTDPEAFVFDPARPDQARLSNDEIRRFDPEVIDVQAHGVTHRPLRDLSDRELMRELSQSREVLSMLTGRDVNSMAVPGNWYDDRVLNFARRAGYQAVFLSDRGRIAPGTDLFRLPRITVQGYKRLESFRSLICPGRRCG